jgi:hypothetical protein
MCMGVCSSTCVCELSFSTRIHQTAFRKNLQETRKNIKTMYRSAITRKVSDKHVNRLVQCKGKRRVFVQLVEPRLSSLNQGDTFVFDGPNRTVWVWSGSKSNRMESVKGFSIALIFKVYMQGHGDGCGRVVLCVVHTSWIRILSVFACVYVCAVCVCVCVFVRVRVYAVTWFFFSSILFCFSLSLSLSLFIHGLSGYGSMSMHSAWALLWNRITSTQAKRLSKRSTASRTKMIWTSFSSCFPEYVSCFRLIGFFFPSFFFGGYVVCVVCISMRR